MRTSLLYLAGLLFVAGCSSGPLVRDAPELAAPAEFPNHSAAQILALMAATDEADSLTAFSSQAKVEIRTPDRSASLSATIRQRAADTLWASARGPLSIEVARARATPDSFAVLDKLHGRLYVGPTAAAAEFLPTPVDTRELFATLLGTLRPEAGISWSVRADTLAPERVGVKGAVDGSGNYYTFTHPEGLSLYVVDAATWRTVRYQRMEGNAVLDVRTFSAFDQIDGRILPRRIELRNPQEAAGLTIEHRKLTLNPPTLAFPFSPGDAEIRRLY